MEKQKLILEYVKTLAIVAGVIFGLIELRNASGQKEIARAQQTAAMLNAFSTDKILASTRAMLRSGMRPPADEQAYANLIIDLIPLHEHFVAWSACIASELCEGRGGDGTPVHANDHL